MVTVNQVMRINKIISYLGHISITLKRETEKETNCKEMDGRTQPEIALRSLCAAASSPEARKIREEPLLHFFLRRVDSCRQDKAGNAAHQMVGNDTYYGTY